MKNSELDNNTVPAIYRVLSVMVKVVAVSAILCWWLLLLVFIVFHLETWWCQILFFVYLLITVLFLVSVVATMVVKARKRITSHQANVESE